MNDQQLLIKNDGNAVQHMDFTESGGQDKSKIMKLLKMRFTISFVHKQFVLIGNMIHIVVMLWVKVLLLMGST